MFLDKDFPRPAKTEARVLVRALAEAEAEIGILRTYQPAPSKDDDLIIQLSTVSADKLLMIRKPLYKEAD